MLVHVVKIDTDSHIDGEHKNRQAQWIKATEWQYQ